jgi:hypothetical protein
MSSCQSNLLRWDLVNFFLGRPRTMLQAWITVPVLFSSFLMVLEFKFRAWHFLDRCSTTWSRPSFLLALGLFWIWSHTYVQISLDRDSPTYAFPIASITDMCHHAQFLRWSLDNFLPGCPWTVILLISASQVSKITCVNHNICLLGFF